MAIYRNVGLDDIYVSRAALFGDAQVMQSVASAQLAIIKLVKSHHHQIDQEQWLGLIEALRVLAKEIDNRGEMRQEWLDNSAEDVWRWLS